MLNFSELEIVLFGSQNHAFRLHDIENFCTTAFEGFKTFCFITLLSATVN